MACDQELQVIRFPVPMISYCYAYVNGILQTSHR